MSRTGKPSRRILRSNGREGQTDGLLQGVVGAGAQAAQERLELGEGLLDRRAVRGIRRQEEQVAAPRREGLANAGRFMGAQLVQHHDLPGPQPRRQFRADVPRERLCVGRAPSISQGSCRPSGLSAATTVVWWPCLRGTAPVARWSWGAQP
jgi:hypothetical protein